MKLCLEKSERASAECSNHLNYGRGGLNEMRGRARLDAPRTFEVRVHNRSEMLRLQEHLYKFA